MCTYLTVTAPVTASVKGPGTQWSRVQQAVVYFDHPAHATAEHTVNIDFAIPNAVAGERVALELTAQGARELVLAIQRVLDSAPAEMTRS